MYVSLTLMIDTKCKLKAGQEAIELYQSLANLIFSELK